MGGRNRTKRGGLIKPTNFNADLDQDETNHFPGFLKGDDSGLKGLIRTHRVWDSGFLQSLHFLDPVRPFIWIG